MRFLGNLQTLNTCEVHQPREILSSQKYITSTYQPCGWLWEKYGARYAFWINKAVIVR